MSSNNSTVSHICIIKTVEKEHQLCQICFFIGHSSDNCQKASQMSCKSCSQQHSTDACNFQVYFSCSTKVCLTSKSGLTASMSLQDVKINENGECTRVLFNNGSELTLVRNSFCFEQDYPRVPMSYSILGVGGVVKDYTAGLDG